MSSIKCSVDTPICECTGEKATEITNYTRYRKIITKSMEMFLLKYYTHCTE